MHDCRYQNAPYSSTVAIISNCSSRSHFKQQRAHVKETLHPSGQRNVSVERQKRMTPLSSHFLYLEGHFNFHVWQKRFVLVALADGLAFPPSNVWMHLVSQSASHHTVLKYLMFRKKDEEIK